MSEFATHLIHAGREELAHLGVHALPIDLSTTNPLPDLDRAGRSLEELAHGAASAPDSVYQRLYNPTVARFEHAMAELEEVTDAVAFSSGMAAITAAILAARQIGRHIIAIRPLYGGTDHLLTSGLLDVDVTFADVSDFEASIRPETSLVILETPANPTLELVDIQDVADRAGAVALMVDSTFATPVLQKPSRHGASLIVHSATKYIGGHGDVMGGVVATNDAWARRLRGVRVATGALLNPKAAYDLHRGLQTLGVRVESQQANAIKLAAWLEGHPAVAKVHFPKGPLIGTQMAGPGAMVSFELRGGYDSARSLMSRLKLITPAVSLGSADSLIQHPASLTHRVVEESARESSGVSSSLVRLSVGLEAPQDLIEDLAQALSPLTMAWDTKGEFARA